MNVRDFLVLKMIIQADFYVVEDKTFGSLGELLQDYSEHEVQGIKRTKGNGVILYLKDPKGVIDAAEVVADKLQKALAQYGDRFEDVTGSPEVLP